jgi:hypothetical protein
MRGHQICEGRKKKGGEQSAQGRLASASSDNIRPGNLFKKFNIQQSPAAAPAHSSLFLSHFCCPATKKHNFIASQINKFCGRHADKNKSTITIGVRAESKDNSRIIICLFARS